MEYNIGEILSIDCRKSKIKEIRFNLLIPALSIRYAFGGIQTALDFFTALAHGEKDVRIIITDEISSDLKGFPQSDKWKLLTSEDEDTGGHTIVCFGDRYNKTIPVRQKDIFVATAWWTSYTGERILNWQKEQWSILPSPLVYLIQDFEAGFYKWSSRYLLALSTLRQKNMVAVVNTSLLYEFIKNNGISFTSFYVFEPGINRGLETYLHLKKNHVKKKTIIFYGRPSVERNAYEVIVQALMYWSLSYANAHDWQIISLGESYPNIRLENNIEITVKGKLSIDEYAELLLDSAIGISLMVSPHPSYPPFEMAAFDLAVITNSFFNKDLSQFHDNICSIESINPENISRLLSELCLTFEKKATSFTNRQFKNLPFLNIQAGFDFIGKLKKQIMPPV